MSMRRRGLAATAAWLATSLTAAWSHPSGLAGSGCDEEPAPPFCKAVRGARAEGWPAQSRSEVLARHGMVVTSQPLAAQAGLQILMQGGNAIDAAVASAAVLSLVEPMMVGVGADLFAVIYIAKDHKIYVLNASGTAPSGATVARLNQLGYRFDPKNWGPMSGMPVHGILPVTVPGAVWGWDAVLKRFGKLTFKQVLEPAVRYAQEGFAVSERIAHDWRLPDALPLRHCCSELDPDSVATWYVHGVAPRMGQIFKNADLARTLRLLQAQGADVFYRGEIAKAIVAKSRALGGSMTLEDLARYHGEWVEPARSKYHGHDLVELPPPSQAWAAEEMLNILQACVPQWVPGETLASLGPASPEYWHLLVEAKKLAYADLYAYNADPDFVAVPLGRLLSPSYAASLCRRVDPHHASTPGPPARSEMSGDTIVLSAADAEGNMVSWVNSNFDEFGSGITVPGYGFVLHDRGALFSLDPHSPNVIAPGKRPFNTLSAGFVMRGAEPVMTVTLMGGDMQAQGHAQLLIDMLDLGANPQAAADMARFRHSQIPNTLGLEAPLYDLVGAQLAAMGHAVSSIDGASVGGVQTIMFVPAPAAAAGTVAGAVPGAAAAAPGAAAGDGHGAPAVEGYYRGASDFRKDGEAVGW
ncbi:MAG TPA: gamma-glutamyltransferase family protein [Steroidobacteraceae bacterium]|nr:gamma-glutamyltransferase family protein [Steroidobacteraceae bacterium]